jgi:hypothetical protein
VAYTVNSALAPTHWFQTMSKMDYIHACKSYNIAVDVQAASSLAITHDGSPVYPSTVFCLEAALAVLKGVGAAPDFVDVKNWADNSFPREVKKHSGLFFFLKFFLLG